MSTYIFSLHAGEYRVWEDQVESRTPLRLFAREALAANVDVDEWFETSRTGLAFYEEYFGIAYPFEKYDQLIVPDFAIGAMENAAAVTFAEGFVQRQLSTRFQRMDRNNVILHRWHTCGLETWGRKSGGMDSG